VPTETTRIRHGRIELALHSRPGRRGPPLLLLHALNTAHTWDLHEIPWAGPVHALDLAGHGASDWLRGGGYTPELFAADADNALAHLGDEARGVCIAGSGIGAYAALLLGGARPEQVSAVLLMPGEGLGRGAGEPDFEQRPQRWAPLEPTSAEHRSDPALVRLNDAIRPRDYARSFAERARQILLLEDADTTAEALPGWWQIAAETPGARKVGPGFTDALEALADLAPHAALDD
jgi:pimeloyl-ACP methyl ester carboxylesterase